MTTLLEETIRMGDKVRSYDFEGNRDCYVEGVVESVGTFANLFPVAFPCSRYKIRVTARVWNGVAVESLADYVYPPVNGSSSMTGDFMNSVESVEVA